MKIKIKKVQEHAILPEYQTALAAGFDFHAAITQPVVIKPGTFETISTGVAVEIPAGYELQIRPRSGLAFKHRVLPVNAIGTIDADYRGEMMVGLLNSGTVDFVVEPGMRIAQGVVAKHETVEWEEVSELSDTERSQGGFGSTGL
ncbi:MAG TPA: dUTP diphosphatase [Candidatus Nanoperiomorbaceae bacterium]|nr:dUTP diphosphatase [Candidatus Nanoperiomorbaceae bacterium]HMQ96723.1 dUTP diphosphatase [Candidatus Nanoperiomorbaceae bacterium]HMR85959.1 dUTP diphosphatase [Candidatus Nanoperiomorbaceae bacterium]HMU11830.1 dUTP diphosphatase [Candidatus Nanoperiomorbaceae bacterium]